MDGVIIADKPERWTSHDVVASIKRSLSARKVGHLGSLDPIATGVLPIVVNKATGFARFLDSGEKRYSATMRLGEETDTYDREGRVTAASDASFVTEAEVLKALSLFVGAIKQTPPMYSAVKQNGVPLYRLARKGITVERKEKEITVFSIDAVNIRMPYVDFNVVCSKGTYIRSICHDAGRVLGCGAHLFALRRTGCGGFLIGDSISPCASEDELRKAIIPVKDALKMSGGSFDGAPSDASAELRA